MHCMQTFKFEFLCLYIISVEVQLKMKLLIDMYLNLSDKNICIHNKWSDRERKSAIYLKTPRRID